MFLQHLLAIFVSDYCASIKPPLVNCLLSCCKDLKYEADMSGIKGLQSFNLQIRTAAWLNFAEA